MRPRRSSCWWSSARRGCLGLDEGSSASASLPSLVECCSSTVVVSGSGKEGVWGDTVSPSVLMLRRGVVPVVEQLTWELPDVRYEVDSRSDGSWRMLHSFASAVVVGLPRSPASEIESTGLYTFSMSSSSPLWSSHKCCHITSSSWWQPNSKGTWNVTDWIDHLPNSTHPCSPHNASWKMYRKATKSYYPRVLNPWWHQKAVRSYCSRAFDCLPGVHFTGEIAWAAAVVAYWRGPHKQ